jgi:hypothetical protein
MESCKVAGFMVTRCGLDGALLDERHVLHVYVFRDDLVARMDVEDLTSV